MSSVQSRESSWVPLGSVIGSVLGGVRAPQSEVPGTIKARHD
jgi:hypothetical protein